MTRFLSAALFLALAGCASTASTPQAQCEASAYDDPEVKNIQEHLAVGVDGAPSLLRERDRALKRATQQCLRDKGLAPPGGVQAHTPAS